MKTIATTYELADSLVVTVTEAPDGVTHISAHYETMGGEATSIFKRVPAQILERVAKLSGDLRGASSHSVCPDHGYYKDKSTYSYRCPECEAEEKARKRLAQEAKENEKGEVD